MSDVAQEIAIAVLGYRNLHPRIPEDPRGLYIVTFPKYAKKGKDGIRGTVRVTNVARPDSDIVIELDRPVVAADLEGANGSVMTHLSTFKCELRFLGIPEMINVLGRMVVAGMKGQRLFPKSGDLPQLPQTVHELLLAAAERTIMIYSVSDVGAGVAQVQRLTKKAKPKAAEKTKAGKLSGATYSYRSTGPGIASDYKHLRQDDASTLVMARQIWAEHGNIEMRRGQHVGKLTLREICKKMEDRGFKLSLRQARFLLLAPPSRITYPSDTTHEVTNATMATMATMLLALLEVMALLQKRSNKG